VEINRRNFLTGAAVAAAMQSSRVLGANDRMRVAVIGLRGRGKDHLKELSKISGVEVAAVCDIDENVIAERLVTMTELGMPNPKTYGDVRKVLEDKSLDAITVAAPNHWHSLMGIWACQAGKDAYIEKPCSHNWYEGHQLVAATEKYKRIVQHGTQSRSSAGIQEAFGHIRNGLLGDVYLSRGLCFKWRDTIGKQPRTRVPEKVNYDLWLGPAPDRGFTKNRFHYNWHWFWDTGNGDLGNQGIHEVDTARWGLGVKFPTKVSAIGGKFMFDDDQETPNVLNCAFEFDSATGKKMMEFEVRHWMTNNEGQIGKLGKSSIPEAGLTVAAKPAPGAAKDLGPASGKPNTIGNLFYGPKGYLAIQEYTTYKSWLGERQEPGPAGYGKENNFQNWVDCVRARDAAKLNAPIAEGHISATLVHLANVSYRLGRTLHFNPETQQVTGDEEANRLLREDDRGYRKGFQIPKNV
jgi:predicted dehydrogenase